MTGPPSHHIEATAGSEHLDLRLVREFDNRSSLWLFEDPEHLRGLLQILDPPLVERLDFAHARRVNRSFVPADLQEKESDLIYAVPFRGAGGPEVWVYVLLEHQSEPDPEMVPMRDGTLLATDLYLPVQSFPGKRGQDLAVRGKRQMTE